jgi:hypothetical protein
MSPEEVEVVLRDAMAWALGEGAKFSDGHPLHKVGDTVMMSPVGAAAWKAGMVPMAANFGSVDHVEERSAVVLGLSDAAIRGITEGWFSLVPLRTFESTRWIDVGSQLARTYRRKQRAE